MKLILVKGIVAACTCATLMAAAAQSPASADFALRLPLTTTGDGLHVVEFPEAVYRASQTRALTDLRIFNSRDEALPIAYVSAPAPLAPVSPAVDLRLARLPVETEARESLLRTLALRVERDRERAVVEIGPASPPVTATPVIGGYLIDARPLKDLKGALVLAFASDAPDYAGSVEILGSDDLVFWRPIVAGPLARTRSLGEGVERNRFDIARPPAFIRVAWRSNDVPSIERAQFVEHVAPSVTLPRATLAATLSDDRRSLYVDVPEALPITRLFVKVPEVNRVLRAQVYRHDAAPSRAHRPIVGPRRTQENWQSIGTIEAFRVLRDGVEVEGAPLAIAFRFSRLRFDFSAPLDGDPPTIEAEWRPLRAIFAARAPGPYVLAIGYRETLAGPMLDAPAILAADDPAGARLPIALVDERAGAAVGPAQQRAQRIASEARWSRYLLWGALAAAVIGLACMAWRMSLQMRRSHPPATGGDAQ